MSILVEQRQIAQRGWLARPQLWQVGTCGRLMPRDVVGRSVTACQLDLPVQRMLVALAALVAHLAHRGLLTVADFARVLEPGLRQLDMRGKMVPQALVDHSVALRQLMLPAQ